MSVGRGRSGAVREGARLKGEEGWREQSEGVRCKIRKREERGRELEGEGGQGGRGEGMQGGRGEGRQGGGREGGRSRIRESESEYILIRSCMGNLFLLSFFSPE